MSVGYLRSFMAMDVRRLDPLVRTQGLERNEE